MKQLKHTINFPDVNQADPSGLIAVGGELSVANLLHAYQNGIFPWPIEEIPLPLWFAPPKRGVLDFADLHVPSRLKRSLKNKTFSFAHNRNFAAVIKACAASTNRGDQQGTWVTPQMQTAYLALHRAGYAHSFECYDVNDQLVGGMYGVWIKHFFAGESMFYLASDASKYVLLCAIDFLSQRGLQWMDLQMITPLTKQFGAKLITRNQYMKLLNQALSKP